MTEDTSALPAGWDTKRVGDVLKLRNGYAFKPTDWASSGRPIIRIQNLKSDAAAYNHYQGELPDRFKAQPGDLLFAWSGTPGTSFGAHIWEGPEAWVNQHIFRVDFSDEDFDRDFLKLALNYNLVDYISQAQGGVGLAHITKAKLDQSLLIHPPLPIQRSIAKIVAEHGILRDSAVRRLREADGSADRFRQAVLNAAFSGRLTTEWRASESSVNSGSDVLARIRHARSSSPKAQIPEQVSIPQGEETPSHWVWARFGSLIAELRNGLSPSPAMEPPGIPILRISATRTGTVDLDDVRYLRDDLEKWSRYELREQDLLFTRYNGSIALLGVCGMVRGIANRIILYPDKLMRARFDSDAIMPEYVELFFSSPRARDRMVAGAVSSAGQQGISGLTVKEQPIAIPPLEEQREIVRRVSALLSSADTLLAHVAEASRAVERTSQAILAKAFQGDLVRVEDLA